MSGFARYLTTVFVAPFLICCACSRETLSERDLAREQARARADIKRSELAAVVGSYGGELTQSTGAIVQSRLYLETKDVPTTVEGQVDPVLVPTLTGYLHLLVGSGPGEYFNYAITRSEFDPNNKKLTFIGSNNQSKDMFFSLDFLDEKLTGTWNAPEVGASGTVVFSKSADTSRLDSMQGEYVGLAVRERNGLYHEASLTLTTHYSPSEGLQLSAGLRIYFGEGADKEFMAYEYPRVEFNPTNGQLTLQSDDGEITVTGNLIKGGFVGQWSTPSVGKMGELILNKGNVPAPPRGKSRIAHVRASYRGKAVSTTDAMDLPERLAMNLVTSIDKTKLNNLKLSGGCRLYLGGFDTAEFEELQFKDVQFNPFTRELVAKTEGQYKLTFQGYLDQTKFIGMVSADGIGKVATFEVEQQ